MHHRFNQSLIIHSGAHVEQMLIIFQLLLTDFPSSASGGSAMLKMIIIMNGILGGIQTECLLNTDL
jgi:hypothetical protein